MARPSLTTAEWITRAKQIHGSRFDYAKSEYIGAHKPIVIVCRAHGDFIQRAGKHLEGQGCRRCNSDSQLKSLEDFVRDAERVHGFFYDYSKVELCSTHQEVIIICPQHGEFRQAPVKHQAGQGCKKCNSGEVWDGDDFIRKATQAHASRYDYTEVVYVRSGEPVRINCKTCNKTFLQRPNAHLRGAGCPYCAGKMKWSDDAFREFLCEAHNGEIISLEEYSSTGAPIRVRHICGHEWTTTANRVVTQRKGCKRCADDRQRMTEDEFTRRLVERHNAEIVALDKYSQSKRRIRVKHLKCGKEWLVEPRVVLRCGCHDCANRKSDMEFRAELKKVHWGEIEAIEPYQTGRHSILVRHKCGQEWRVNPVDLVAKGTGCPWCASSRSNREITRILSLNNITFSAEVRFDTCRDKIQLPFDFCLSDHNVLIEYDGEQHFQAIDYWGGEAGLADRKKKDQIKNRWATENRFRLYRIRYDEDLETRLSAILKEIGQGEV